MLNHFQSCLFRLLISLVLALSLTLSARSQTENAPWKKLLDSANSLSDAGNQDSAIVIARQALDLAEFEFGKMDTTVASICHKIGVYYYYNSEFSKAELPYRRAIAIREEKLGPHHLDLSGSLNNLAVIYDNLGKHTDAEPMYLRALEIVESALGPEHKEVAYSLHNLGGFYQRLSKYDKAAPMHERALVILEKILGSEHPDVAKVLTSLANAYRHIGKYTEAEPLQLRSLTIREESYGPEHPTVAISLLNLANLYKQGGKLLEAEQLYMRGLAIWEKTLGPDHMNVSLSLFNLADLFVEQGKLSEAESFYMRALAIQEGKLGPYHPGVAISLGDISRLYRLQGRIQQSLQTEKRRYDIRMRHFQETCFVLAEKDALAFSRGVRLSANSFLTSYLEARESNPQDDNIAATIIMSSKGQVSDMVFERRKPLVTETDSTVLSLADSLRVNRTSLAKLFVSGPDYADTTGGYKHELDSLSDLVNRLESDLARKSARFARIMSWHDVSVERIISLMPDKSVLLEYLKFDYHQLEPDTNIQHYLVATIDETSLRGIIDLGEARPIDFVIGEYKKHIAAISEQSSAPTKKQKEDYQSIAQELYDAIVRPVEKHLENNRQVLVAPDGALNLISFAGLIDDNGKYLIEKYSIHYLSAARDLIRLSDPGESGQNLFALADPDYDATAEARLGESDDVLYASVDPGDHSTNRNVRSGCGDLRELTVDPLPYTRKEVEGIVLHWNASNEESAIVYFGAGASEENFKAEATGKRIIHLATHGYYLEGYCNPEQETQGTGEESRFIGENPLLLSGLLFAGANLHGQDLDSWMAEDGILSAYEVSAMDLDGTDMVVLSACETGLGEVRDGEGVYGLRRAFQLAGARTVVCALWPVADKQTVELMAELYQTSQESLPDRIRRVQLAQIAKLRAAGLSDHPFTWAAFIATGDWR